MTDTVKTTKVVEADANRDPITGEPGSHPVGTAAGATGGGAAGAIVGTAVAGPVGGIVGGAIGAVAGGLGGHAAAEKIDPTVETAYWRENYASRDYVTTGEPYETYEPAYRYGWESRVRQADRKWDQVENDLEREWEEFKGESRLKWQEAKHATRDAWHRVERAIPGDADGDGR